MDPFQELVLIQSAVAFGALQNGPWIEIAYF